MKFSKIILLISGLILIIVPFFINVFSIYKLIFVLLGIILIDISILLGKKKNIFLVIYLPILLLIITYSIDYMKTYTLSLKPIYVLENKINDQVSIYNSLFYRVYKCDNDYIFDNNYQKSYSCDTDLIDNIDINKLLNEPDKSYKKYKNDFIKVTGKISKINGNSTIELREYSNVDNSINGYVSFNNSSKLVVEIDDDIISNYKVYDYITVVGILKSYNKNTNELTLIDTLFEDNDLYNDYSIEVIENQKCLKDYNEYMENYFSKCINNIYIDYKIDKYELKYLIKDGKLSINDLYKNAIVQEKNKNKLYKFEKFNILACHNGKNYLLASDEDVDYYLCEE